jgi:transcriptional regulator with XRE-family HTH domain
MAPEMPIGERIRLYRVRRGLTQALLAERVGRSTSWLSQVERGIRGVDNWRVILDLADVLRCDPRDLVGRPLNLAPNGGIQFRSLDDLRSVLTGYEWLLSMVDVADREAKPSDLPIVGTMQQLVDEANRQYQAAHYEEAARSLVRVIRRAEPTKRAVTTPGDDRPIHALLAEAYQAVAKTLTKIDQTELSWVAAERAAAAAERAEDPRLVAATAYHVGHAFRRAGRVTEAIAVSERAYEALVRRYRSGKRDPGFLSLVGGLTLTSVIAAAADGDQPSVHELLGRAAGLASELAHDGNEYWFAFGPTNVQIHRLAVAVELGEPREAVRVGEEISTAALPSGLVGRRTAVLLDLARAYGQLRMDPAAVNMLTEAERIAPQTVRYNKFVRELTRDLLRREHRASTPQLLPFAERLGLLD